MLFCKFKMLLTSEEFYHKTPIVFTITNFNLFDKLLPNANHKELLFHYCI